MFKQFATKEIVNVAMVVTGFTIVGCILLYTFIKTDLMKDSIRYETALANTVLRSMRYAMLQSDFGSLEQMIQDIGAQEKVQYARIFKCTGEIRFSSDLDEVGSQVDRESPGCVICHSHPEPANLVRDTEHESLYISDREEKVLALMAPISNDTDCSSVNCHYHPPDKVLLGVLNIGVSQENLEKSLSVLRLRLIAFCAMILVLTVGGVTALLWRSVMLPLTRIADFAENRAQGRLDEKPPRGTGDIKRLADAIQKLVPGEEAAETDGVEREDSPGDPGR